MTMFDVNIGNIYRFLVMKEAFEAGLITADTWKQILEQLMRLCVHFDARCSDGDTECKGD